MEEEIIYDTIRVYDAVNNIYYDKQVPHIVDMEQERATKLGELESYIANLKNTGVEYQGKWFKCDDECKNNLTQSMLFIDSLLPLTWFTRNGEQGVVVFNTKEEFMAFVQIIAGKLAEIQNKYYAFKYAIENADTKEALDEIIFEEVVSDEA